MNDAERALAELTEIRSRMAAATAFHGFGPSALAATGILALLTAAGQALWSPAPIPALPYFATWTAVALLSAAVIGAEMIGRSRRHHSDLAEAMILNAVLTFLPFGAAGAALLIVLGRFAPAELWLLPGLWQILVGLGVFAASRTLPRAVIIAGAWYFLAGLAVIMLTAGSRSLSPFAMGLPFGLGQLLVAAIMHLSSRADEEA
jgi:hypothetical protein